MARLPRLMGRGRALEVLLEQEWANWRSCTATSIELYQDSDLDAFVDALAVRIASFDKQAIADSKRLVDIASLPSDAEIMPEWDAFIASVNRPASQDRIKALIARGFHSVGDVEDRLGYYVGQIGHALDGPGAH